MYRLIILSLVIISFLLAGCQKKEAEPVKEQEQTEEPAVSDTAAVDTLEGEEM